MRRRWGLGIGVALGLALWAFEAEAVTRERLEERYQALLIDGSFDAEDAERLVDLALSDDLWISAEEAAFLAEVRERHGVDEGEAWEADGPETPLVKRARTWMLQAMRGGPASTAYLRAMRQLIALAMDPELGRDERFRLLELTDRYRRVERTHATRDALEAIALLLANPTEARLDREHRRKLELLEKRFQVPVILDGTSRQPGGPAAGKGRPGSR